MTPAFCVLLPHKRNPGNDSALAIALDCLMRNTRHDFILFMDSAFDSPLYPRMNALVENAPTDCCVMLSSDLFVAPSWDVPMLDLYNENTFVTNIVVEPGAIGVHPQNLQRDFGRKPDSFRRSEFEAWAQSEDAPFMGGEGWVVPLMFSATRWLELGSVDTSDGCDFPEIPPDQALIDRHKAEGGFVERAKSYTYHLQRFSDESEQGAGKRA